MKLDDNLLTESQILDLITVSEQAGQILLSYFGKNLKITNKDDNTPVTIADLESSNVLIKGIKQISEYPIISEECLDNNYEHLDWDTFWLIDPLDGTKNFIRGNKEFCICISLVHKNSSIFGLIYSPVTKECWYANKNCGVFKLKDGNKIKLSAPKNNKIIVTTGSCLDNINNKLSYFLSNLPSYVHSKKGCALKYTDIAEGKANIYPRFGNTSEWDTAAGQIILNELGGDVISIHGKTLTYGKNKSFLNPNFIAFLGDDVESIVKSIIKEFEII